MTCEKETYAITLLGMSGVGKTTLSNKLPKHEWFHYSGDYRIATHYLRDHLGDFLKQEGMKNPVLAALLRKNAIQIKANVSIDNLSLTSAFMGKLGAVDQGGSTKATFITRQRLHREAEIAACYDVGYFKQKAASVYGYPHFVYDAGGSICELASPEVIEYLAKETQLVYIKASTAHENMLIERALANPKPMYYDENFLNEKIEVYQQDTGNSIESCHPDDFIRFLIPEVLKHRSQRYLDIAKTYGVVLQADDVARVKDAAEFLALVKDSSTHC